MREICIPLRSYFILKTLFILSRKQNPRIHEEKPELSHTERAKTLYLFLRAVQVKGKDRILEDCVRKSQLGIRKYPPSFLRDAW